MAMTTSTIADVSQVLAEVIGTVEGLRTAWYIADNSRPPCAVLSQPTITYDDPETPFCFGTYEYSVVIVVNRSSDRDAQSDLARFVSETARVLNDAVPPDGVFSIEPLSASPTTVTLGGQELPAYQLRARVRA